MGLSTAVLAFGLTGCASKGLTEGRQLIASGQTEAGIARLQAGIKEEPDNIELRGVYFTQRERLASQLLTQAQLDLDAARFDAAEATLRKVIAIHPENPRAGTLLANLTAARAQEQKLQEAHSALAAGRKSEAEQTARLILAQAPGHAGALAMLQKIQALHAASDLRPRELGAAFQKPITLEFRDVALRNVFDMISRQSGINFIFDKDVRLDNKATLFARNTPIADAIDMVLTTGQLSRKIVNPNTILIYPDQPQKQKAYQELIVKSFYLGNADAKTTMAMLRTLIKSRDIFVDERLNMLIMRDTPEAIRLAERIIAVQDLAEPEVMLDVEVLEIKRGRLLDLGIQYPNQLSLLNLPPTTTSTIGQGGVIVNTTPPPSVLTVDSLRNISSAKVAISPTPAVNLRKDDSDVNILANPRIRVKNREKAKIHIGDKVPVITSNATSTGVISETVSYLDVGLKLDVEPSVLMRDDVQIKVGLEVSSIVREIRSGTGTLTYQIGTRNAGTTLRLKDGETQVLAGLISDEDRSTASRVPGLGDLPLLGRLFSTQRDERSKTEIVLLITPRVLRSDATLQPALTEFRGGTENDIGGGLGVVFAPSAPPAGRVFAAPDAPDAPEVDSATGDAPPPAALPPTPTVPAPTMLPGGLQLAPQN
ncbi:MAG: type II secretion system protein D [Thiobacillus sp.]|nr:type II secretion system protein D [Thiobacillus sp.]